MDHYDDTVRIQEIVAECNPGKLDRRLIAILQECVGIETGVSDFNQQRILTDRFLVDTYKGLIAQPTDAPHFESGENFIRALTRGIMAQAQEYGQLIMAEKRLPPGRFGNDELRR